MARYIDADKLLEVLNEELMYESTIHTEEHEEYLKKGLRVAIYDVKRFPTADVVPKSEYEAVVSAVDNSTQEFLKLHDVYQEQKAEIERLEEELSKANADVKNYMKVAEYQQSLSVKRYHEIKRLKEDIERLEEINERDVENIQLAKAEVAREIFEEIEKLIGRYWNENYYGMAGLEADLYEFKQKYTED